MPKIVSDDEFTTSAALTPKSAKVAHVKRGKQDRAHHCHWPGCNKQVPPAMWGCKAHWFRLPKRLRDAVWAAYRPGQETTMTPSREYLAIAQEVQDWVLLNTEGCAACGGTGKNSKGGPCAPCVANGRTK